MNGFGAGFCRAAMFVGVMTALAACATDVARTPTPTPRPLSAEALREAVGTALGVPGGVPSVDADPVGTFYRARDYQPLWVAPTGLTEPGRYVLSRLERSSEEAIDPREFKFEATKWDDPASLAATEIALSRGMLRYAAALRGVQAQDAGLLAAASTGGDLAAWFDSLAPTDPAYRTLRSALARYREIAAAGGWPVLPPGAKLQPGAVDPRVLTLRQRLATTGDLAPDAATGPAFYDGALAAAVARFQARHGLQPDGIVGLRTLAALNVPADMRVSQIAEGLRVLRGPDFRFSGRGIVVNIAAAEASLIEDGRVLMTSRVIVGKPDWPTPILRSSITALEFNPSWVVPTRIALEEIMPRAREQGSAYLQRKGFRVFDGKSREIEAGAIDWASIKEDRMPVILRQEPGPGNPLGRVKFLFANSYDVYLHDTPSRGLFRRDDRALSHGCVRVEGALDLALLLLKGNGWAQTDMRRTLDGGETTRIRLAAPVAVHLVVLPAWTDADGSVQFREDPYASAATPEIAASGGAPPADI